MTEKVTREAWRQRVDKDLKGASFEKRLVKHIDQDIRVEPLYTQQDWPGQGDPGGFPGQGTLRRGATALGTSRQSWQLRQRLTHPDPTTTAAHAVHDLERGVDALLLRFDQATRSGTDQGFGQDGLAAHSPQALAAALEGVRLDEAPVALEAGAGTARAAQWLVDLLQSRGQSLEQAHFSLGFDPLGTFAAHGGDPQQLPQAMVQMGQWLKQTAQTDHCRTVRIDTSAYHHAGADEVQDLAFAAATAVAYLRALEPTGLGLDTICADFEFHHRVDTAFFVGIAKLRAARVIWARIQEACGVAKPTSHQVAEASDRALTRRDPWVNMLRNTTCVFAGAVGGASAIVSTPFDTPLGPADDFSRRIARNTSIVLAQESHLHRVIDPAGGSWTIEHLTDQLATRAWDLFQQIEQAGGMQKALTSGWVHDQIQTVADKRRRDVARRKRPIIGVSQYPNLTENPIDKANIDLEAIASKWGKPEQNSSHPVARPLPPAQRLSAPFEDMRARSDALMHNQQARPQIFSANMGTIAQHTGRATFARNLLEAGGFEILTNDGFNTAAEAAAAFTASNASMAVVCSSDAVYKDQGAEVFSALKAAGATRIILAGKPRDNQERWQEAGMTHALFMGCDALALLEDLWEALK